MAQGQLHHQMVHPGRNNESQKLYPWKQTHRQPHQTASCSQPLLTSWITTQSLLSSELPGPCIYLYLPKSYDLPFSLQEGKLQCPGNRGYTPSNRDTVFLETKVDLRCAACTVPLARGQILWHSDLCLCKITVWPLQVWDHLRDTELCMFDTNDWVLRVPHCMLSAMNIYIAFYVTDKRSFPLPFLLC